MLTELREFQKWIKLNASSEDDNLIVDRQIWLEIGNIAYFYEYAAATDHYITAIVLKNGNKLVVDLLFSDFERLMNLSKNESNSSRNYVH